MIYTRVNDQWHLLADERTACNIAVPFGAEWVREKPADDLCPDCFPDEAKPKRAAKKAA